MPDVAEEYIDSVCTYLADQLGLRFDDSRRREVRAEIAARIQATGSSGSAGYWQHLVASGTSGPELRALAERLTVGETYFFRGASQFAAFVEVALPARLRARSAVRRLRILSAGCASGEEAYTLAIHLAESGVDLSSWKIEICAIDLNPAAIARAREALYTPWSLRETSPAMIDRYFRREGNAFRLIDSIRNAVTFHERNIHADDTQFWQPASFDIIFCRNVVIYFSPEAFSGLIARFATALVPHGYLFMGHAETLRGVTHDFHLLHSTDAFYYQRKDPAGQPANLTGDSRQVEPTTSVPLAPDKTWVEAIREASVRIATLADRAVVPPSAVGRVTRPLLEVATDLLREERFADAAELLKSPDAADVDAQLLLAVVLSIRGELAEAERVCLLVLALDEMNAGAHYVMALCREHAGDMAGAREHDRFAVYLDGDFAMPHFHLGLLARRAGEFDTARRELNEARLLFAREDSSRILLFGGGFGRELLIGLCRSQLKACGERL